MDELRAEHSANVTEMNRQLSAAVEKNNAQWREERDRLEQHYNSIMSENVNRQQVGLPIWRLRCKTIDTYM